MSTGERSASTFGWVREKYTSGALVLLNTLVVLILINVFLAVVFFVRDRLPTSPQQPSVPVVAADTVLFKPDGSPIPTANRSDYQLEWVDFSAYEGISELYVGDVLDDFFDLGNLGFAYQPWVHYSEPLFDGERVRVVPDQLGFPVRQTLNPSNDKQHPVARVFVLGGSTTFGYNVSDAHTFPTYLSTILNERARTAKLSAHIEVTNYGHAFFYPSQETQLLIDLLKMGHRPKAVIFMDGVNQGDVQDLPRLYSRFERQFRQMQFGEADQSDPSVASVVGRQQWIPMVRLVQAVRRRIRTAPREPEGEQAREYPEPRHVINMFNHSQRVSQAVCRAYKIKCLFFLQPNASYNYPMSLYRRALPQSFMSEHDWVQPIYGELQHATGRIYLGDLFRLWGDGRKAIVDDVHYSPGFNRFLAGHTAKHVDLQDLVPALSTINESEATGSARSRH